MNMHKSIRLTPIDRKKIWSLYVQKKMSKVKLGKMFGVTRQTIAKVIERARHGEFYPRHSCNNRYKQAFYGFRRLAKVEKRLEEKLKRQARRYNKSYPGEMVHMDNKRLNPLPGAKTREYLFVAIDDYSRELYAQILADKSQYSSAKFLNDVLEETPYTIEVVYTDNGSEYKGTPHHAFVKACAEKRINQQFTRVARPQTNGKAERVIRTLLNMWHDKYIFESEEQRTMELNKFVCFYNKKKIQKGIENLTPQEKLSIYFNQKC